MSNEPKLMFYANKEQTKPLPTLNGMPLIDFPELDADEKGIAEIYALNYGERDLRKILVLPSDKRVEVLEYPVELPVGILGKITLRFSPSDGENLLAPLIIEGKYYKRKK